MVRFIIKRNNESATLLIMSLSEYLTNKSLREMSQYLDALRQLFEQQKREQMKSQQESVKQRR